MGVRFKAVVDAMLAVGLVLGSGMVVWGQVGHSDAAKLPRRIHLILKDGNYQVVLSYEVAGKIVRYVSAERGGEQEDSGRVGGSGGDAQVGEEPCSGGGG